MTRAVFVIVRTAVPGLSTIVTRAVPSRAIDPSSQVTVEPLWEQLPWLGVIEVTVTLEGRVSVTRTLVAGAGPSFTTSIVYVNEPPAATGSGSSVFVIERSARHSENSEVEPASVWPGSVNRVAVAVITSVGVVSPASVTWPLQFPAESVITFRVPTSV